MDKEKGLPKRKDIRLKNFDYSSAGAYFITICVEKRCQILSDIVGEGSPLPRLRIYGEIAEKWIKDISQKYPTITVDYYVIMPNHIHLLLSVACEGGRGDPSPTVKAAMGWLKYQATKEINNIRGKSGERFFQRSFYDHIVRNQKDYEECYKYIYENPIKWRFDELYCDLQEISMLSEQELLNMTPGELVDLGICPTCFNREHNGAIYGDNKDKMLYEDNDIECFFVGTPRAEGHMCISTMQHYHDMSEAPDEINQKIIRFAKQFMIIIKRIYDCERVYMCTMCDGPNNHYHIQLIPRYSFEERGSKNFVKQRRPYIPDDDKLQMVKKAIAEYAKTNK